MTSRNRYFTLRAWTLGLLLAGGLVASGCGTDAEDDTDSGTVDVGDDGGGGDAGVDGGGTACEGPDPSQTCMDTGCAEGETCEMIPDGCVPSSCGCDEATGSWTCTADCGPGYECVVEGECAGPDPSMGCLDGGCPDRQTCVEDPDACAPSSCFCDEGGWVCTEDCGPGNVCVPETPGCTEPDPSITCQDTGCPDDQICVPADTDRCVPSSCACDEESGTWECTADCGSDYVCVDDTGCSTPDPSETCMDTGCPDGQECIIDDADACLPGSCACDPATDTWGCTEDCNPSYTCAALIGEVCPEEEPIGEACDPEVNTELCGWGTECCCGECYNSIECTCSDDGTWACYATDACFIESCAGRACEGDADCEGGAFALSCVDGFCAREAANCEGLGEDVCGDTTGCRWYYGGPCSDGGGEAIRLDESACLSDLPCESSSDCPEGTVCTTYEVTPWCAVPEDPDDPVCGACSMTVSICSAE